jgi:hypothetical protein
MPFERKREGQAIQATQNPLFRTRSDQSGHDRNAIRRVDFGHDGMASFRRPRFSFFKKTKTASTGSRMGP